MANSKPTQVSPTSPFPLLYTKHLPIQASHQFARLREHLSEIRTKIHSNRHTVASECSWLNSAALPNQERELGICLLHLDIVLLDELPGTNDLPRSADQKGNWYKHRDHDFRLKSQEISIHNSGKQKQTRQSTHRAPLLVSPFWQKCSLISRRCFGSAERRDAIVANRCVNTHYFSFSVRKHFRAALFFGAGVRWCAACTSVFRVLCMAPFRYVTRNTSGNLVWLRLVNSPENKHNHWLKSTLIDQTPNRPHIKTNEIFHIY